jgi:hypothetical protein
MGLHSGPVTAGVLKGEKSRFQLFGDTVNTAARMESTGMASRIQCSPSTGTLLREAGKGKWIREREELVSAKGKGEIQTYWISPRPSASSLNKGRTSEEVDWDMADTNGEYQGSVPVVFDMSRHIHEKQRMIDWNVEVLCGHLKRIEARRQELSTLLKRNASFKEEEKEMIHFEHQEGATAVDEVAEIIKLPMNGPRGISKTRSQRNIQDTKSKKMAPVITPDIIDLDDDVVSQVSNIVRDGPACNYRPCPGWPCFWRVV